MVELNFIIIIIDMSLITVSAIVNADASFVIPPFGLPGKKHISVHQVATAPGMYQVSSKRWMEVITVHT
jgi:hypothetical protein